MNLISERINDFDQAIDYLKSELSKLRTGRANPALVEDVDVDYYDQKMKVKQLANVSVPEGRQLLIQPWDKNAVAPIEKSIQESDLGMNPTNEGDKLRITLPELTNERREELAKLVNKMAEEARIKVRNIREEISKQIKTDEKSSKITEDDREDLLERLQKEVDEHNEQIKNLAEKKEKEIKTV